MKLIGNLLYLSSNLGVTWPSLYLYPTIHSLSPILLRFSPSLSTSLSPYATPRAHCASPLTNPAHVSPPFFNRFSPKKRKLRLPCFASPTPLTQLLPTIISFHSSSPSANVRRLNGAL
ncbi:hypothetical protein VNO80_19600 [Phaseolus coccineus]|uniref:Uncharacterized protein n=1 Tax=Phaseolus coccineus TaxID=3886 RepID=A0AAN9MLI2_PHACN